jgi:hypothetical protein
VAINLAAGRGHLPSSGNENERNLTTGTESKGWKCVMAWQ